MGGSALLAGFAAPPAHADADFQLASWFGAGWMRQAPDLKLTESVELGTRELAAQSRLANRGSRALVGGGVDTTLVLDDRWLVPLFGGSFHAALGPYDGTYTSVDGSLARLRPWSATRVDILLPGLGLRAKHRRWMWGAEVRAGISGYQENVSIASAASSMSAEASAVTFLAVGRLEACRRLDPVTRLCLDVQPRLYDFSAMNGVMFGLRIEWGR